MLLRQQCIVESRIARNNKNYTNCGLEKCANRMKAYTMPLCPSMIKVYGCEINGGRA